MSEYAVGQIVRHSVVLFFVIYFFYLERVDALAKINVHALDKPGYFLISDINNNLYF